MYVVTFYSFKGGVGRTLALANIGLELARTGRRVLLVDFDLEAPGLGTFDILSHGEKHPGLVEYVSNFVESRSAPDVRDYTYEVSGAGRDGGRLWIMPAGMDDAEYARKLNEISWVQLYDRSDGFLMFEDLKAQWEAAFDPHYVLVDSRTGHTDIGGICTRQLPNAVVFFFFPNEQNLRGLKPIVSSIRRENTRRSQLDDGGHSQDITMHFVMSNVPDLDDEQEILAGMQDAFRRELGYDTLTCVVHRYDSLSLLKQSLFVAERPKSRLAREYRYLLDAITSRNLQDREVVIRVLGNRMPSFDVYPMRGRENLEIKADDVLKYHSHDGEVLYLLATYLKRRGRLEESQMLLTRSIDLNYRSPEALLAQAETRLLSDQRDINEIWDGVWQAFQSNKLSRDELTKGIEIVRRTIPERLDDIVDAPSCRNLDVFGCLGLAEELRWSASGMRGSLKLLSRCERNPDLDALHSDLIRLEKSLALISLGRFVDAMRLFGAVRPAPRDLGINDAFNYAMAEWADTRKIPTDMFEQVVARDAQRTSGGDANYLQCLAVAFWATHRPEDASRSIAAAETQVGERPRPQFSCWRYVNVNPPVFMEDCGAIRALISGKHVVPLFFGANSLFDDMRGN
jgi:MinD-like ATPase involved in chromosome partitioning or flagellar assembly